LATVDDAREAAAIAADEAGLRLLERGIDPVRPLRREAEFLGSRLDEPVKVQL
jgi:hypothetical protein